MNTALFIILTSSERLTMKSPVVATLFTAALPLAKASTWYVLDYELPSGAAFLSQSGDMVAPTLPGAATYYLWPGLEPSDNSGVYQNVLDGRSGTWWFGSGWCCSNPSLAWGGGFNVANGDTVSFSNTQQADGSWTSTVTDLASGSTATNNFALEGKDFTVASYAIELDGPTWDFGPLTFKNLIMVCTRDYPRTQHSFANLEQPYNSSRLTLSLSLDRKRYRCFVVQRQPGQSLRLHRVLHLRCLIVRHR